MHDFTTVVFVGNVPAGETASGRERRADLFCKIRYEDGRLSISGVEGPKENGDALGGCGQIDMHYAHRDPADDDPRYTYRITPAEIRFREPWDADVWLQFLDVWKRWHMNDLRAECEHQRALGWTYATHSGQKCPECDYLIGSAWLREVVPDDVLAFLADLPESEKAPAWV